MPSQRLYFAYGSNLWSPDLASWCRSHGATTLELRACGRAFLPDRYLSFPHRSSSRGGGVLDVPERLGCSVLGILFDLPSEGAATLDRKETTGHEYRRIETVTLAEG